MVIFSFENTAGSSPVVDRNMPPFEMSLHCSVPSLVPSRRGHHGIEAGGVPLLRLAAATPTRGTAGRAPGAGAGDPE